MAVCIVPVERFTPPPHPPDYSVLQPTPASLTHRVKHMNTRELYGVKGDISGQIIALRRAFMQHLAADCPHVVQEWQDLLQLAEPATMTRPDLYRGADGNLRRRREVTGAEADAAIETYETALLAWATRHHIAADWLVSFAHGRLGRVVNFGGRMPPPGTYPAFLGLGDYIPSNLYYVPTAEPFTPRGYEPSTESPSDYKKHVIEQLSAYLEKVTARLDAEPTIERMPELNALSLAAVRQAVRWQVLGEQPTAHHRTVRKLLRQLDLKPRPGLHG